MTLEEKKAELIEDLSLLPSAQDRLLYLVEAARKEPPLGEEFRTELFKVQGCLSNLWFVPELREGRCYFRADGDSHIVKAIAVLLCKFYSGFTPEEIEASDPAFLAEVGISQHLSPNRRNALSRLWEYIHGFAEKAARAG